jgi:hypothetical protein
MLGTIADGQYTRSVDVNGNGSIENIEQSFLLARTTDRRIMEIIMATRLLLV